MTSVSNWSANATVPAAFGDAITPSTSELGRPVRSVYVGVTGHLVVRHCGATAYTTYENVPVGVHPVQVDMVLAHATTALTAGKLVGMG